MANKSLIDNPLADMDLGNLNGFAMSDLSQFNKVANDTNNEVKVVNTEEELKASVSEYLKEDLRSAKNVSDDEKEIIQKLINDNNESILDKYKEEIKNLPKKENDLDTLKEMIEQHKEKVSDTKPYVSSEATKDRYTKKTYQVKDEYIEIIWGLHLLKEMELKEVVNQLLGKAINDLGEDTINKAIRKARQDNKKDNNLF